MSDMSKNAIAGHGQHSHDVPTVTGLVVEITDGAHEGTSVWKCEDGSFRFALHDQGKVCRAKRAILVAGQDVEELGHEVFGCDLDTPRGLLLIGVGLDDGLTWLTAGADVLWDSAA